MAKRKKRWSYGAGEPGRNWVRAFQHWRDGSFYLEWMEVTPTGRKRRRAKLRGEQSRTRAKEKADELAAALRLAVHAMEELLARRLSLSATQARMLSGAAVDLRLGQVGGYGVPGSAYAAFPKSALPAGD